MHPDPSAKGTINIASDVHWGNVWAYDPDRYLLDGEWTRWNTRVCYTLEDALSVGALIPVAGRSGGFADPLIEGFHNAFHLGNASRDEFPQNESHIWTTGSGTTQTLARGDAWGLGDLAAFAVLHRHGTRATPSVTVCGQVSFPTGDAEELLGLGDVSASISVLASKRLWTCPVIVFAGAGFSCCPADEIGAVQLRQEEYSGLIGFEYEYSHSLSLIGQYLGSSPAADDYAAFSEPCHEVSAGFKWRISDAVVVEFAVTENVAIFKNSTDIGAHLSFARQL